MLHINWVFIFLSYFFCNICFSCCEKNIFNIRPQSFPILTEIYSHVSWRDFGGIFWFLVLSWAACFLGMLWAPSWGFFFLPPFPSFSTFLDTQFIFHIHFSLPISSGKDFHDGLVVKNLPAMQEMWVRSLDQEDPLEEEMATCSSILAWIIPWTEETGGYSPWGHKQSDLTELLSISSGNVHERS